MAAALGFGSGPEAVLAMNRTHDPVHVLASRLLGLPRSPTLHWVATKEPAHPTRHADAVGFEEDLVLDLQRWAQTGEHGPSMRVLWLLGWSEDGVRKALEGIG